MNNVAKVYHRLGMSCYLMYLNAWFAIISMYNIIGKFEQSEALFEECLSKRIKLFGESHPVCISTMASLAAVRLERS